MNFTELKARLSTRGFTMLDDTRLGEFVNDACAELDSMLLWPYREKSAIGVAPLTVSDLGTIEAVSNETSDRSLTLADFRDLRDNYGDLSTTGTPEFYYVAWPAGVPVVATYPTNADTIGVQYYRVPPELYSTDNPLSPVRFHGIIVDIAVRMAYRDRDNHEAAEALQVEIDRRLKVMVDALLGQSIQGPSQMQQITGASVDW